MWDEISWNNQGGANSVSQVDGDSDMVPACQISVGVRGRSEKEQWTLPALLSGRKLLQPPAPALTLMPDTSVPPHMPLVSFKLLPRAGAQRK